MAVLGPLRLNMAVRRSFYTSKVAPNGMEMRCLAHFQAVFVTESRYGWSRAPSAAKISAPRLLRPQPPSLSVSMREAEVRPLRLQKALEKPTLCLGRLRSLENGFRTALRSFGRPRKGMKRPCSRYRKAPKGLEKGLRAFNLGLEALQSWRTRPSTWI